MSSPLVSPTPGPGPQRSRAGRLPAALRAGAVERARLTVVPRTRRRASKVPFVALVSLVMLGGVVGLLLFNTSMQQASFAATALQDQAQRLAQREESLRAELDELRSPQRVAEQARDLGMVVPTAPAFLDLRTGEVIGGAPARPEDHLRIEPAAPPKPAVLSPAPVVVEVEPPQEAPVEDRSGPARRDAASPARPGERSRAEDRGRGRQDERTTRPTRTTRR